MPTSLYIVGLDPRCEFRPSQAPWAAGQPGDQCSRLGFNDHLFDQGHAIISMTVRLFAGAM